MYKTTVIAKQSVYNDEFSLVINVEHYEQHLDVLDAMRQAAKEFCQTDAGRREIAANSGNYNWGDFVNSIPESFCRKYGFKIKSTTVSEIIVDHNESLLPE